MVFEELRGGFMRLRTNDREGSHLVAYIFDTALSDLLGLAERSTHADNRALVLFDPWYAIARERQMEGLMDEILKIVDDTSHDYVEKTGADGKVTRVFNKEHFEDRRRRINARNWTLTHLAPKKYRYW